MKQATLVRNLKLFNAKERDHLMRAAYLGVDGRYEDTTQFLSKNFDEKLKTHAMDLGLDNSAHCVFAGMDYHLDWLFAALWMTANHPNWHGKPDDEICLPLETHKKVDGINNLHSDFRPITGTQEDIDLLVVYTDGKNLAMLVIEAKGSAAFDRVQLGRKLIRLDRIIAHADSELQMQCRLVLVAPKKPNFKDKEGNEYKSWISFAKGLPEKRAKEFEVMNAALSEIKSNIGDEIHFMQLTEYPEKLYAVERQRETKSKEGAYTHCKLKLRKPTKNAT